jgi:multisubunit Na+/H+ antiporter MnhG subunit
MRWLVILVATIVIVSFAWPWLARLGLGRLPGDFTFTHRGRTYRVPITTTVLLSLFLSLVLRVFGR